MIVDLFGKSGRGGPRVNAERLLRRWGGPVMPYAAAVGAVLGSWLLVGVPLAVVLVLAAACLWRPSPLLVLVAVAALAGFLGSRAVDGLADPPDGPLAGWVTLLDDPRPLGTHGIRVTVRHGDARLEARAYGAVAARLDDALAGERVHISGVARPATSDWHRWRHVASTLNVDAVGGRADAAPLGAFTNRVRRLLESGAGSLPDDSRAMFAGMVYGDDRSQSPRLYDDFRAAGLGHLLVVSGQNVALRNGYTPGMTACELTDEGGCACGGTAEHYKRSGLIRCQRSGRVLYRPDPPEAPSE